MITLGWTLVILLFVVGMVGAVYPILPGVLAIYGAFFIYGWLVSWKPFGIWFWLIETLIVILVIVADYAVSALGVQKFGGTKAAIIGSTIGLIVGPFVIPAFGIILGPFIGAVIGELIIGTAWQQAVRAGIGSVLGFIASTVVKIALQLAMIVIFFLWVL